MPSFDVVSEVDQHEVTNAVDQTNREIGNRFDFKGSNANVVQTGDLLTLEAESEFQVDQIKDVLFKKMARRSVDVTALKEEAVETSGNRVRQQIQVRQGIDQETGKKIVKLVKGSKLKVQAAIQGEQVRITGKKRDDLQQVIALLKESDLGLPLQYVNFRD